MSHASVFITVNAKVTSLALHCGASVPSLLERECKQLINSIECM